MPGQGEAARQATGWMRLGLNDLHLHDSSWISRAWAQAQHPWCSVSCQAQHGKAPACRWLHKVALARVPCVQVLCALVMSPTHRWLHKVALAQVLWEAHAACEHLCALVNAPLDHCLHALVLGLGDHRPHAHPRSRHHADLGKGRGVCEVDGGVRWVCLQVHKRERAAEQASSAVRGSTCGELSCARGGEAAAPPGSSAPRTWMDSARLTRRARNFSATPLCTRSRDVALHTWPFTCEGGLCTLTVGQIREWQAKLPDLLLKIDRTLRIYGLKHGAAPYPAHVQSVQTV